MKNSQKKVSLISNHSSGLIDWHELWSFRELFYFLVWRDIKIHYSQTLLGVLWVILQPLLTMAVFTLFFGRVANLGSANAPYSLFVLSALLPWLFFSNGFNLSTSSLVIESQLMKKIYFPRALIPLAKIFGGLLDLSIGLLFLTLWSCYQEFYPSAHWLLLPVAILNLLITTSGIGLFFSSLNMFYRDIKHIATFMIQLWLFASPVVYALDIIPTTWQYWYALNPLVGTIEAFRWIIVGHTSMTAGMFAISLASSLASFLLGVLYFNRSEPHFADLV